MSSVLRGLCGEGQFAYVEGELADSERLPLMRLRDGGSAHRWGTAIYVGSVAAACDLGDDHQVAVFVHNPLPVLADQLTAAGVPHRRLRNSTF